MRIGRTTAALAVALAFAGFATTASATEPHHRSGFFIGFGLGAGNASWDWTDPDIESPSEGSGVGNFRIGGAIRDDLVLGLESSSWVKNYDVVAGGQNVGDAKVTFSAATFAATWFPGNVGAFIRGGVGAAQAKGEVTIADFVSFDDEDAGFALLAAGGYEWRLSNKFALGPQVEFVFLGIDGNVVDNVVIFDGSVQFNWYW